MAHEYAILILGFGRKENLKELVDESFRYADAMQAEADKRKITGVPDAISGFKSGGCISKKNPEISEIVSPTEYFFYGNEILIPSNSMELEWQPDWSQAPGWANYWRLLENDSFVWLSHNFIPDTDINFRPIGYNWDFALSFNYQGNFKDSLRKRP